MTYTVYVHPDGVKPIRIHGSYASLCKQLLKYDIKLIGRCSIGKNVVLSPGVTIYDMASLGNYVWIGTQTTIASGTTLCDRVNVACFSRISGFVGRGTHIDSHVSSDGVIGAYCLLHRGVSVGTGAVLGDAVVVCEHAHIGAKTRLAANTTVYSCVNIGVNVRLTKTSAGAILHDIPDNTTARVKAFSQEHIYLLLGLVPYAKNEYVVFKAVNHDLTATSPNAKAYRYKVGCSDSMSLKRDNTVHCGKGWHFTTYLGALRYARNEGLKAYKIISARVKLKDIVSVSGSKMRVKAYSNVQIVKLFNH